MKRSRATLLFFFMALTLFFGCGLAQEGDDEAIEIVDEVNRQYEESASRQDADAMAELYTEDGQFLYQGAQITGREALNANYKRAFGPVVAENGSGVVESIFKGAFTVGPVEISLNEAEFLDSSDLVYGIGTMVTIGPEGEYESIWMGIYKEEDGEWRIHRLMTARAY